MSFRMVRTRSAPDCASVSGARNAEGVRPSSMSSSECSRLASTYARGLLISWASPAASVPSAASRSELRSCSSIFLEDATSRRTATTACSFPCESRMGEASVSHSTSAPSLVLETSWPRHGRPASSSAQAAA